MNSIFLSSIVNRILKCTVTTSINSVVYNVLLFTFDAKSQMTCVICKRRIKDCISNIVNRYAYIILIYSNLSWYLKLPVSPWHQGSFTMMEYIFTNIDTLHHTLGIDTEKTCILQNKRQVKTWISYEVLKHETIYATSLFDCCIPCSAPHLKLQMIYATFDLQTRPCLPQSNTFWNPVMHLSHIPKWFIQNRNIHVSVLNGALRAMGHVYSWICELGQFGPLWLRYMMMVYELLFGTNRNYNVRYREIVVTTHVSFVIIRRQGIVCRSRTMRGPFMITQCSTC